jgi:hypothetical protein
VRIDPAHEIAADLGPQHPGGAAPDRGRAQRAGARERVTAPCEALRLSARQEPGDDGESAFREIVGDPVRDRREARYAKSPG